MIYSCSVADKMTVTGAIQVCLEWGVHIGVFTSQFLKIEMEIYLSKTPNVILDLLEFSNKNRRG